MGINKCWLQSQHISMKQQLYSRFCLQVFSSSFSVDFSGWIWMMPRPCCVLCVTCGYKGWTSGKQDGCQFRQSGHRFKNIHLQRNILPMLNPLSGSPGYLLFAAKYLNNTGPRLRLSWVKTAAGFWQCLGDDAENTGGGERAGHLYIYKTIFLVDIMDTGLLDNRIELNWNIRSGKRTIVEN